MTLNKPRTAVLVSAAIVVLALLLSAALVAAPFSAEDVLILKRVSEAAMSPDGNWIAYTVSVPRAAADEPGPSYSELYVASTVTRQVFPFVVGPVGVTSPQWSPDGSRIAFLAARGPNAKTQVWMISGTGGEAAQITSSEPPVLSFHWHPSGAKIGYIAMPSPTAREKDLGKMGYGFIYFEENLRPRNLYIIGVGPEGATGAAEQLTDKISVWDFDFSPDGKLVAAGISPRDLVDDRYMFQKIYVIDLASKAMRQLTNNPGKLGDFDWSPDGSMIAYNAGIAQDDEAASQVFVIPAEGGDAVNLTPSDFRGTVDWVGWKDKATVLYRASEGMYPTLSTVPAKGGPRTVILDARASGLIFDTPSFTADFKHFAFGVSSPSIAGDLFTWTPGSKAPTQLATVNPFMIDRDLGKQEVVRWKARDGAEIEGLLIYPVGYKQSEKCPLIAIVHGGPESNYSNGWVTRYSEPAQALAGKGYAVLLPNYRASTGYGLAFELAGLGDPGGKEFDDVADGIDYLVSQGIADPNRVGLCGGSYGGYAAAWFASYYTAKVRAVVMFVGISDLVSKRLTTDIPYEELYVHSGKPLEEMWSLDRERSPIYWAHQCKTAVLILGGAADTRVYPGQSLEFYRILKLDGKPAVRLVQYPGEGHGNAKQPGRIDVLYRSLDWLDWYVRDLKPLDGPMPPLDISHRYGLGLGE